MNKNKTKLRRTVKFENAFVKVRRLSMSDKVFLTIGWNEQIQAFIPLSPGKAREIGKWLTEASKLKTDWSAKK